MTSLKRDKVCPQCEGRKVWWVEAPSSFGVVAQGRGAFEQFICASCGYLELYARGIEGLQHNPGYGVHFIDDEPKAGLR